MLQKYFIFALPIMIIELLAAISGTFYIKKVPDTSFRTKAFVFFLWFTFLIELLSTYAVIGYFSDYNYFYFIKDTSFRKAFWLQNVYNLIAAPFLMIYFSSFFKKHKIIFWGLATIHFLVELITYFFTEAFLNPHLPQIEVSSAIFILVTISIFFIKLSSTDLVLILKDYLPFYLAIGTLIFWLCTAPLSIFSDHFSTSGGSDLFITLHMHIMLYSNIFMYSCFIFGFLLCYKKMKSY